MEDMMIKDFIDKLSSASPTPGGGAVATIVTSLAIGLARMSLNVSIKRKTFLELEEEVQERVNMVNNWLSKLTADCSLLQEEDENAFKHYMDIYKNATKEEIQKASFACYNVPYKLLELNYKVVEMVFFIKPYIVKSIISDYKMSLYLLKASLSSCLVNMEINIVNIKDEDIILECKQAHETVDKVCKRIDALLGEI